MTKFDVVEETICSHSEDSSLPSTSSFPDTPTKSLAPSPRSLSALTSTSSTDSIDLHRTAEDGSVRVVSPVHADPASDPGPEDPSPGPNLPSRLHPCPYSDRSTLTLETCHSQVRTGVSCTNILRGSVGGPIKKRILIREGFRTPVDEGTFTPCPRCAGWAGFPFPHFLAS